MHGKKIVWNSIIGVIYKILMLLIGFVSRKIFIIYLGEEVLGLNSLYANLLDLLNLADLGIGVAVQYQLYEPLVKRDTDKLSKILSSAKKLYNRIGLGVLMGGCALSFFIQYLIKSTTYPIWFVRTSFLISVIGVALGYFFVHKRLFLQANEQLGIVNIIDLITKVFITIVSLIATVLYSNYFIYLIINVTYGVISNIVIHFAFQRRYSNIKANRNDIELETKELTHSLKDVVPMRLTNYVYNSTDNIVISKMLGLATVALYSNYMTIINGIMGMEYIYGNVITSSMGKILKENHEKEKVFQYYLIFQYAQFIFTNFCTVSITILCTPFIKVWVGEHFIVDNTVFILLVIDFFIHSMYQPAYVMYGAAGEFKKDKYVTLGSAIINIIVSVSMVKFIGLAGVIIGTLVSDIYIWILRSYQIVKIRFNQSVINYTLRMVFYTLITLCSIILCIFICSYIKPDSLLLELFLKACICLVMPNAICIIVTSKSDEFIFIIKKMISLRR